MSPAAKPRVVVTEQASLTDRRDESLSSTGTRQILTDLAGKKHGPTNGRRGKKSRRFYFPWSFNNLDAECTLPGEHKHGWKPVTLGFPVLGAFAIISLLLAAIIEVLAQQSQIAGGLALSSSPDDFPTYVSFSYLFLPTIIAVIYSLFWSWVDLDAKRLQAWFELSKDDGATARDSLLLSYPYDFVGFVPFTAFKRRHWQTFSAGTAMVVIFLFVTPLQSAILGTGTVLVSQPVDVVATSELRPASDHAQLLDQSILNEAYAITWLNQPHPAFTTPEYTVIPFSAFAEASQTTSINLTGTSTKYWTQLECWPADISRTEPPSKRTFDFNNGRGCNASDISPYPLFGPDFPYKILYLGYQVSPWVDYSLSSPTCPNDASHQFLATWARGNNLNISEFRDDELDVEALFCETSYHKQRVQVSVISSDFAPISQTLVPLEPPKPVSESEFNITAFEYLLGSGVSSVELRTQREFPFGRMLEQYPQTMDLGLTYPMSAMTGFAVGSQQEPSLDAFRDLEVLGNAFNATHKLVFSLAMRRLLSNITVAGPEQGTMHVELHGVVVSRLFSAIVEGLLGLIAVLAVALWWSCHTTPSKLVHDPASLASLIGICRRSSALLADFSGKGCHTEKDFIQLFAMQRFQLVCGCESSTGQMVIRVHDQSAGNGQQQQSDQISLGSEDSLLLKGHYDPVKPWALRRDVGLGVILVMIGAIAFLSYLKTEEQSTGGLARPDASFEVLQILFNYLPTAFATTFEPFWVLVNRLLCMLQPFKDLWNGHKRAKGSIGARYTSIPPQLVFWRAAGSQHYLLATVCSIALLSNVLAVGLGGLFNELPVQTNHSRMFQQTLAPSFLNESIHDFNHLAGNPAMLPYEEHFYVTMNNVSQNTLLPPWIGREYFFQPLVLPDTEESTAQSYVARSRGFGVTPFCSPAGRYTTRGEAPVLNATVSRDDRVVSECETSFQAPSLSLNTTRYALPSGASSAEVVDTATSSMSLDVCHTKFFLGWSRSSDAQNPDGEMDTSFMICEPRFSTAIFDVTVDPRGHILSANRVSELEATLNYVDSTNHTDSMIVILHHMLRNSQIQWHNDTLSRDWINYLLKIRQGHEEILDPDSALPDPAEMVPHVEAIYRQLYALMLGLNQDLFDRAQEPVWIEGTETRTEVRIFMPLSAFIISMVVLGLNVLTAAALYTRGVKFFLPRMPTTIGSTLAYIAPSRAIREYRTKEDAGSEPARTFSFGRYVGEDGCAHVGIELDPYVVPVDLSSLKRGNTLPSTTVFRRMFKPGPRSRNGDTWL